MDLTNALGQPIGPPVSGGFPLSPPARAEMRGRFVCLRPADPDRHADALHAAFMESTDHAIWTYLPYGPFATAGDLRAWMQATCTGDDPRFFVIHDLVRQRPAGVASYLRINCQAGSVEVGHLNFAPALQRTPAATEAMALMMERAFALGYRRYEWKCDALNAGSRRAAERLGFTFEGIHRQATHYKGRNRDTAWFSILDHEWLGVKAGLDAWLSPDNFDEHGVQRRSLAACRAAP